jgi:hypothetical protein
MTRDQIHRQLQDAFRRYLGVSPGTTQGLVPQSVSAGKLYEAHVLSRVVERLVDAEGYALTLVGGTKLQLKALRVRSIAPTPGSNSYALGNALPGG